MPLAGQAADLETTVLCYQYTAAHYLKAIPTTPANNSPSAVAVPKTQRLVETARIPGSIGSTLGQM